MNKWQLLGITLLLIAFSLGLLAGTLPYVLASRQSHSVLVIELSSSTSPAPIQEVRSQFVNFSIPQKTYQVREGDRLWTIAVRFYGNGRLWPTIAAANHIDNPNHIHAGDVLIIPEGANQ